MDPQHFRQVLWNLLVNAGEAIEGSGRISVEVSPERNHRVQIRVTDNGCGMHPDDIKSIFDPFYHQTHWNRPGIVYRSPHSGSL